MTVNPKYQNTKLDTEHGNDRSLLQPMEQSEKASQNLHITFADEDEDCVMGIRLCHSFEHILGSGRPRIEGWINRNGE